MGNTGKAHKAKHPANTRKKSYGYKTPVVIFIILAAAAIFIIINNQPREPKQSELPVGAGTLPAKPQTKHQFADKWLQQAYAIDALFHSVYTPCWEGAYGAIGDAYLFAATKDSSLLRFHLIENDMRRMCKGTWVDDRAWVCLAEFAWWNFTGRANGSLVEDARGRYLEARREGRLSSHEGFWSWYNWPPSGRVNERVFTNSNMNQMVSVACWLYEATGDRTFLNDAMLVWNGDSKYPGVWKTLYRGNGRWEGKPGLAAFGKQLPWDGAEYCSICASLYRVTKDRNFKKIIVATAKRIMDPANGWVDPADYYQIHMDGNGAFVNYLLDAYMAAPEDLKEIPDKISRMLDHVWTNHEGMARITLHRESDDGIRNGWNPYGGEDGYGVDEVGTVHAQAEALRAFGIFAYVMNTRAK